MARFWVFFEFWGPRGPRVGLKTSKMDSARVKTPILTPHTCLNSLWGPNGDFGPFLGSDPKKGPKIGISGPLWLAIARLAGLGWGGDIRRWNRMVGGYKNMQKKHGSAPNPGALEPKNPKKSPFWCVRQLWGPISRPFGLGWG